MHKLTEALFFLRYKSIFKRFRSLSVLFFRVGIDDKSFVMVMSEMYAVSKEK